ncbi:GTPase Era, mitochondrial [Thrips palmi]|uniref:GTPase Era, mitochondrial n=1 Tax=Thrips palmi TaxID=161013 RepID=A0A6P8YJI4_THRPL|nr:GTPase Era, mitochondrial [Thrips palmi]
MWVLCQSVLTQSKFSLRLGSCQTLQLSLRTLAQNLNNIQDEIQTKTSQNPTKVIKVALIGRPNAGKSTLINQIVGRTVSPVSMKTHTTRAKVKAFTNVEDTQIVFFDTPGLVSPDEVKKLKFESEFLRSAEGAIQEADVLGVLHDVSGYKSDMLDPSVIRHLLLYQRKKTFLLLNKVDAIKRKGSLLGLVRSLTKSPKSPIPAKANLTEQQVAALSVNLSSWPHFCEVFMVSALEGNGVGDVKEYLLHEAQPGEWLFTDKKLRNQHRLAVDFVKAACLDYLPDEVPYKLQFKLSYFEDYEDSCAVEVRIVPANKRHARMIMDRVRPIAQYAEANLGSALEKECRLRLDIQQEEIF